MYNPIFSSSYLPFFVFFSENPNCEVGFSNAFLVHLLVAWRLQLTYIYIFPPLIECIVQFSHSVVSDSLWPHESQHARPPCPSPTPRVHSDSCPSISDAIQPSHPLSSPSPPAPNPSQHQSLFQWVSSSHEVAKVQSAGKNAGV